MENQSPARPSRKPPEATSSPGPKDALRTPITRPPVLASDILREEVAPLEPGKLALRLWLAGLAAAMALLGLAVRLQWVQGSAQQERIAYGIAAVVVLALMLPYRIRGILVVLAGLTSLVLGLLGRGPLSGLVYPATTTGYEIARALAATALPAALLFRARYRAYRGARIALVVGLVLAVPEIVHLVLVVASGRMFAQVSAALALLAILTSLLGFMGSGTTAASTAWAVAVMVTLGADVAARCLWMQDAPITKASQILAGIAFIVSCALVALGLFKILASMLASDARRVDVLGADDEPRPVSDSVEGGD